MNSMQLRANGFTIFPIGRKVCFVDNRNGYCSPSYLPHVAETKLAEYLGLHRAPSANEEKTP